MGELKLDYSKKPRMIIQTFSEVIEIAKGIEMPKMLFSEFWHEGEACMLFADTNLGKSALAMQIAISIASGTPIKGFKMEAKAQEIIYYDFELSEKQLEGRFAEEDPITGKLKNHFKFHSNLKRCVFNYGSEVKSKGILADIEDSLLQTNAKIIVIDNLTALGEEMEQAKHANILMKGLLRLKTKYKISILIIAHTPKRDTTRPITKNDLAGSAVLGNLADSIFAIGSSYQSDLRFIKQIKQRYTEQMYGTDNVVVCRLAKPSNILSFYFQEYGYEQEHLQVKTLEDKQAIKEDIVKYKKDNPDKSIRAMAKEFACTNSFIQRALARG